jgi:hypothetical protein
LEGGRKGDMHQQSDIQLRLHLACSQNSLVVIEGRFQNSDAGRMPLDRQLSFLIRIVYGCGRKASTRSHVTVGSGQPCCLWIAQRQ